MKIDEIKIHVEKLKEDISKVLAVENVAFIPVQEGDTRLEKLL